MQIVGTNRKAGCKWASLYKNYLQTEITLASSRRCYIPRTYLEVPGVDLIDDLQVSGQDELQHGHRPALQCLREEGVVCVGKGQSADVPGLLPAQLLLVQENTHQLRDSQRWVSVVQLDSNLGWGVGGGGTCLLLSALVLPTAVLKMVLC